MPTNKFSSDPGALAFIGFGEAANAFARGLRKGGIEQISAFDIKTEQGQKLRSEKFQDYLKVGVTGLVDAQACLTEAQIVFCMVTPDQALVAAQSAAKGISQRGAHQTGTTTPTYFLDANSCSPEAKKQAAKVINATGARYVDVAIMAPVHPELHKTPLLASGEWANEAIELISPLGMRAELVPGGVGAAASIKLIRSIMVKGLEALIAECVLSGVKAGVANQVLASLEQSHPGFNWQSQAAYMLERMTKHGGRRAQEMNEAALCVSNLAVEPNMALATARWQETIGDLNINVDEVGFQARADAILVALDAKGLSDGGPVGSSNLSTPSKDNSNETPNSPGLRPLES